MNELEQGIAALRAGQRDEARKLLASAIKQEPNSELAWKWMFNAANNATEQKYCLEQVLKINPHNTQAIKLLSGLQFYSKSPKSPEAENLEVFADKLGGWVKGAQEWPEMDTFAAELEKRKQENVAFQKVINPPISNAEKFGILGKSLQSIGCLMTVFVSIPACLCLLFLLFQNK